MDSKDFHAFFLLPLVTQTKACTPSFVRIVPAAQSGLEVAALIPNVSPCVPTAWGPVSSDSGGPLPPGLAVAEGRGQVESVLELLLTPADTFHDNNNTRIYYARVSKKKVKFQDASRIHSQLLS